MLEIHLHALQESCAASGRRVVVIISSELHYVHQGPNPRLWKAGKAKTVLPIK